MVPPVVREEGAYTGSSSFSELWDEGQVPVRLPEKLDLFRWLVGREEQRVWNPTEV